MPIHSKRPAARHQRYYLEPPIPLSRSLYTLQIPCATIAVVLYHFHFISIALALIIVTVVLSVFSEPNTSFCNCCSSTLWAHNNIHVLLTSLVSFQAVNSPMISSTKFLIISVIYKLLFSLLPYYLYLQSMA